MQDQQKISIVQNNAITYDLFDGQQRTFEEKKQIIERLSKSDFDNILTIKRLTNILKENNLDQLESYLLIARKSFGDDYDAAQLLASEEGCFDSVAKGQKGHYKKMHSIIKNLNIGKLIYKDIEFKKSVDILFIIFKTFDIETMSFSMDLMPKDHLGEGVLRCKDHSVLEPMFPIMELLLRESHPSKMIMYNIEKMFMSGLSHDSFGALLDVLTWTPQQKRELIVLDFFRKLYYHYHDLNARVGPVLHQMDILSYEVFPCSKKLRVHLMDKDYNIYTKPIFDIEPEELIIETNFCYHSRFFDQEFFLHLAFLHLDNIKYLRIKELHKKDSFHLFYNEFLKRYEWTLKDSRSKRRILLLPLKYRYSALNNIKLIASYDKMDSINHDKKFFTKISNKSGYLLYSYIARDLEMEKR